MNWISVIKTAKGNILHTLENNTGTEIQRIIVFGNERSILEELEQLRGTMSIGNNEGYISTDSPISSMKIDLCPIIMSVLRG